ncbi:MAG: DUF4105 domain-containing protein [Spirochaetia bacterium]|jgi:hypothetical protein|nr:DUF4105 domain-containing protein [Spirochaetia bacterium]
MRGFLKKPVVFILVLLAYAYCAHAQENAAPERDTGDLVFKLLVFGPSDKIFIWWGHAALVVENTRWNFSRVFDWGIFSYPSDNFLWDFVNDRVRYRCRAGPLDLGEYLGEDRDIAAYVLDFDAAGKRAVLDYAENKVLPENCYYDYHEFRNNCSTGIRDLIDIGTHGRLRAATEESPGRLSLRQHARRFSWRDPLADWLLDFLMGQNLDEPVSVWQEMFLPAEIARVAGDFRYADASGAERKLVASAQILNATKTRHPYLQEPLRQWPACLVLGTFAAMFFARLKTLREKFPRAGRILWGLGQSLCGLLLGAAGCVLFFAYFLMNNDYVQQNANILFVNPLLLAAVPLGVLAALGSPRSIGALGAAAGRASFPERLLRVLWLYVFVAGSASLLARVLPGFFQQNQALLALVLPVAFVLGHGPDELRAIRARLRRRGASPTATGTTDRAE